MSSKRVLPILFATLLLDMIGIGMVIPIIPVLFTDPSSPAFILHGYSQAMQYFIAGLITALFGLMQFIAAPILGELSDAYGRKRLLTVGVGVLAVSQILFGFGIEFASLGLLLFARTVAGLAGANFSIAQAAIADVSSHEDRAKNFGLIGAAFGVGFILGPVLSGWIAGLTGDAASPFWLAGALGIVNLVFVTLMLPETRRVAAEARQKFTLLKGIHNIIAAFKDVDARPVYLSSFLYMSGFSFVVSFMGVMLVKRFGFSEADVGTFFGAVGAWVVLTQLVILRFLAGRYSERQILRVSMLGLALSMLAYPFAGSTAWLYIIMPFMAIPQGLSMANINSLVSKSVSADKQGAALGINSSLLAFAQGVVPLVAGAASAAFGVAIPFIMGALFVFFAWLNLFFIARR